MLSPIAADHVQRPRNHGPLAGATHRGEAGSPGGGPYAVVHLRIEDDRIAQASYECNGCPSAIAASSMTVTLVAGRTVEQAASLEPSDVLTVLGGLPEGKAECADRAVAALRAALAPP